MNITTFVILHYETINDTKKCLDSLIKYVDSGDTYIIVVDNGSKVGRLYDLEKEYQFNKFVVFIRSETNLGFAKGNNLGFKYAKDILNSKFIILANNDIVFEEGNFVKKLKSLYKERQFDVAGPKIISLIDGKNQNPVKKMYNNQLDVRKRLKKFRILMLFSYLNIDIIVQRFTRKKIDEFVPKFDEDIQLHGACLIFSENYINNYSGLYDGTFMYGEESILKYIAERDQMKMIYTDQLKVYHKEGSSTDSIYGKGIKKRQFYYKWNIESCEILLKIMG
ncbi:MULTISPECIES: glycosyltransferase [Clostridium]|uniref:glycosyltransferase n=1 Tax=Clostridium TaxID=1485 RepID=UPI00037CD2C2|nr:MULTISPECIES: glycosyltransferase [Clostridium]MBY7026491.1 glycosyltransferase family 2 protein [Clostridium botulinum]